MPTRAPTAATSVTGAPSNAKGVAGPAVLLSISWASAGDNAALRQRQSFLALRMAERLGLPPAEREVVYYSSLLAWVGCHVDAYEQAKWVRRRPGRQA